MLLNVCKLLFIVMELVFLRLDICISDYFLIICEILLLGGFVGNCFWKYYRFIFVYDKDL